jgi:hypothetical protein
MKNIFKEPKDNQSVSKKKSGKKKKIKEVRIKSKKTKKGFFVASNQSVAVSKNGDFIWGNHLTEFPKGKLLRQCFSTGESFLYDYEHEKLIVSVMVVEDLHTVISGGWDNKAVLHDLDSGKIKKIIDLQDWSLYCLYRFGNVVAVGFGTMVWFLDMFKRKFMKLSHVKLKQKSICMLTRKGKSKGNNVELLVGNWSSKLKQVTIKLK